MADDDKKKSVVGTEAGGSGKDAGIYTLTGGDHPGLLITHVQLKGENYEEWAMAMRMALRAKKKLGFINGTLEQPEMNSPTFAYIDRSNPAAAIESLKQAAQAVVRKKLSLIIFPEGTRSADGRLLPFKKGLVHLALQTGLPIVPIVLIGTHQACRKGSLRVQPTPLTMKYLSPIKTEDWTAEKIDEYIKLIHDLYVHHLPESQRPLALAETTNGTKS